MSGKRKRRKRINLGSVDTTTLVTELRHRRLQSLDNYRYWSAVVSGIQLSAYNFGAESIRINIDPESAEGITEQERSVLRFYRVAFRTGAGICLYDLPAVGTRVRLRQRKGSIRITDSKVIGYETEIDKD